MRLRPTATRLPRSSETNRRRSESDAGRRPDRESGSAVLVVFALLLICLSLAIGNNVALDMLHKELRLIERRQEHRLEHAQGTNSTAEPAMPQVIPTASFRAKDPEP